MTRFRGEDGPLQRVRAVAAVRREVDRRQVERPRVTEWARAALGFEADEKQAEVLDCEERQVMLCCSRQWGKTSVTAVRALYEAWWRPGTLVACVSKSARQSRFFVHKVKQLAVGRLGAKVRKDARDTGGAGLSVLLENGSAVVGLPGNAETTRGLSGVDFLIVDEAARVKDAVYFAARPFLATTGGRLWLLSTPNGEKGFFYDAWHNEKEAWRRVMAPATKCGRISAEFLAGERQAMGERMFRQEYLCEFLASRSQLIPRKVVDGAVTAEEKALDLRRVFGEE